ncbi:MAG: sigma-70 family RNA polymerase sigma factor [Clostridia bacterium]|nr:sigma-70 family RNA polymerase sigma factor [Clostridia bacterium]
MNKQRADQVITQYLNKIYGFAINKSFSFDEAEDLCSEIIYAVYTSLLKADEIYNIDGYIWRISEHTYAKYVSAKKRREGASIDGLILPYYDSYSFENNNEEKIRLSREVAYLSKQRRQIVYKYYYENKKMHEIARMLDIPIGTVKYHLNQARSELKEGINMERKIGNLGLNPIEARGYGHSGNPGNNNGPETYIGDKLNLNIVYSVYFEPRTLKEIAEELGVTPVFIEDKVKLLEDNGFLVKTKGNRYTTYVNFEPQKYSLALREESYKISLEIADVIAKEYVPIVRQAVADTKDVYIPSGNFELLEAAAIFYAITNKCVIPMSKDMSKYDIKTTAGGDFVASVYLHAEQEDKDYIPTIQMKDYWACGSMLRDSKKYSSVYSWSIDSELSSRKGAWRNNDYRDYEYVYELITGEICDNSANAEKFKRLREREFITEENQVNIMIIKGTSQAFFNKIPELGNTIKERFASKILEIAMMKTKYYPPQMHDLIVTWTVSGFIGCEVAIMVMEKLYKEGIFKPLTEQERVTSNLLMFCDRLPQ